jgi:hypothetical protein
MKTLRSIGSILFACLVLVSSTSFMVGIHHCGGQVKQVALFSNAEACEMERDVPPCHRALATSCCDDVTVVHEDQDFSGSAPSFDLPVAVADVAPLGSLALAEVIPATTPSFFCFYDPPILKTNRPASLQVFLI